MSPRSRRPDSGAKTPGRNLSDILYPTLDLHGQTADEAQRSARGWLEARQADGERQVRLITGRGMHSVGMPVLPTAVKELLDSLRGTLVERYEREPGGGAYRVELRRAVAVSGSDTPARLSRLPPHLIRQAEEALVELGVTPTPALIEEEARKIQAERKGETR